MRTLMNIQARLAIACCSLAAGAVLAQDVGPSPTPPPAPTADPAGQPATPSTSRSTGAGSFLSVPGYAENVIPDIGLRGPQREAFIQRLVSYRPNGLGYRVEFNRRFAHAYPTVMIVPDVASFMDAMKLWLSSDRFPILIDDGTPEARQNIARFVRSFREAYRQPIDVVRWSTPTPRAITDPVEETEATLARTFQASIPRLQPPQFIQILARVGKPPPGVVVADPDHPSWICAVPLALAHNQPILWVDAPRNFDTPATEEQIVDINLQIEGLLELLDVSWNDQGDMIEAVTLLLDVAPMYTASDGQRYATTDRIGRDSVDHSKRWAWAGQFHGSAPEAAYRVMSSLFSNARRAWMFDSYPDEEPWSRYAMSKLQRVLGPPVWTSTFDLPPDSGSRLHWLNRAETPVDSELIMVNTKGLQDRFELSPGLGRPGDLPVLKKPAGVYFIHSWSAANPASPYTLAGRWFERGAFAFVGSVEEPGLAGFVTPELVGGRLIRPAPWGAVVRKPTPRPWKIAVFGDPLWTPGPRQNPSRKPWPFQNSVKLRSEVGPLAAEGRYAEAIETLHMLASDEDAVRLVRSALADDPANATPDLAAAAIPTLFMRSERDLLIELYRALDADRAGDIAYQDYLWHAA
ncbi:MAG: hypothetical protein AAGK04_09565, partial [Planctomycetota bacterium]